MEAKKLKALNEFMADGDKTDYLSDAFERGWDAHNAISPPTTKQSAKQRQELFNHLQREHDLTLLESELDFIIIIVESLSKTTPIQAETSEEEAIKKEIPEFNIWRDRCQKMVKKAMSVYKYSDSDISSRKVLKEAHNQNLTLKGRLNIIDQFGESKFKEGILFEQNRHPK